MAKASCSPRDDLRASRRPPPSPPPPRRPPRTAASSPTIPTAAGMRRWQRNGAQRERAGTPMTPPPTPCSPQLRPPMARQPTTAPTPTAQRHRRARRARRRIHSRISRRRRRRPRHPAAGGGWWRPKPRRGVVPSQRACRRCRPMPLEPARGGGGGGGSGSVSRRGSGDALGGVAPALAAGAASAVAGGGGGGGGAGPSSLRRCLYCDVAGGQGKQRADPLMRRRFSDTSSLLAHTSSTSVADGGRPRASRPAPRDDGTFESWARSLAAHAPPAQARGAAIAAGFRALALNLPLVATVTVYLRELRTSRGQSSAASLAPPPKALAATMAGGGGGAGGGRGGCAGGGAGSGDGGGGCGGGVRDVDPELPSRRPRHRPGTAAPAPSPTCVCLATSAWGAPRRAIRLRRYLRGQLLHRGWPATAGLGVRRELRCESQRVLGQMCLSFYQNGTRSFDSPHREFIYTCAKPGEY